MCLFEVNTLILDTISMRLKKNLNASDLQLLLLQLYCTVLTRSIFQYHII